MVEEYLGPPPCHKKSTPLSSLSNTILLNDERTTLPEAEGHGRNSISTKARVLTRAQGKVAYSGEGRPTMPYSGLISLVRFQIWGIRFLIYQLHHNTQFV